MSNDEYPNSGNPKLGSKTTVQEDILAGVVVGCLVCLVLWATVWS